MSKIIGGQNFNTGDTVTSTSLNNICNNASFGADAVVANGGLIVSTGALDIGTIPASKLSTFTIAGTGIVAEQIADTTITTGKIAPLAITSAQIEAIGPKWTAQSGATLGTLSFSGNSSITGAATIGGSLTIGTAPMAIPDGSAPIFGCRAWVNFNGTTNANISGTYSRAGTAITIAGASNHGLIVGNRVFIDFTGGTGGLAFDGVYEVASVIDVNSFTVTSSASGIITAGTAVLNRKTIRGSGNISCISESPTLPIIPPTAAQTKTTGCYIMNFSKNMPDENFAAYGSANDGTLTNAGANQFLNGSPVLTKTAFAYLTCWNTGSGLADMAFVSATVIR